MSTHEHLLERKKVTPPALFLLMRDIGDSIRSGPARAGLSYLAVTIGIASLVVLGAVLNGLQERAQSLVQDLGGNVLAIEAPRKTTGKPTEPLSWRDRDVVAASLPLAVASCARQYEVEDVSRASFKVVETDEHWAAARDWVVEQGRFLDRIDIQLGARSAVLSADLSSLWRVGVGDVVRLQGESYTVVGIAGRMVSVPSGETRGVGLSLGERTVFVPYTARNPWQPVAQAEKAAVDALFVRFPGNTDVETWVPVVAQLLGTQGRHTADWSYTTPRRLIAGIRRTQRSIQWAGGSIAFLSLMLGGTTLMSLMVANVRERIAEIGLRRALGATPRDVAALFVVEAWVVMLCAGLTGVTVAAVLLFAIREQLPIPYAWNVRVCGIPLLTAIFIGTVFAYWPAAMAARISPAEALRND